MESRPPVAREDGIDADGDFVLDALLSSVAPSEAPEAEGLASPCLLQGVASPCLGLPTTSMRRWRLLSVPRRVRGPESTRLLHCFVPFS